MHNAEILSLTLNILVGIYFAWFYPRSVRKKMRGQQLPPAFVMLLKVIPPVGYLVIGGSLGYALYRLFTA